MFLDDTVKTEPRFEVPDYRAISASLPDYRPVLDCLPSFLKKFGAEGQKEVVGADLGPQRQHPKVYLEVLGRQTQGKKAEHIENAKASKRLRQDAGGGTCPFGVGKRDYFYSANIAGQCKASKDDKAQPQMTRAGKRGPSGRGSSRTHAALHT